MVKVKKRMEDFDKAKLKKSLMRAGAKESHARKVADKITGKVKNGTRTVEIWEWAIAELRPLNPKAATAYRTHRYKMKKKRKR